MGYGWRKIRLLSSLKSEMKRTVLSFFGIINIGAPYWERFDLLYDLKSLELIDLLFERECMYAWNRKRFSMIWFCIWFRFNSIGLTIPCAYITIKKYSYLLNSVYISFLSWRSRWLEFSTMVLRSYSVYIASRMRFIIFISELNGALYCDNANT